MNPSLAPALTPELLDRLRERVQNTLLHLIETNRRTRYIRESPVFADFRTALDALSDSSDVESLLESFRTTVPLTSYGSYEPFVDKLITPNSRERDVKDMFSPGLPYFVACSSATSGKKSKLFAKYRHAARSSLQDVDEHANPVSTQGGKNCVVYSLVYRDIIHVVDDERTTVAQFPLTNMSSGAIRMQHGMDVDKDPFFITLTGIYIPLPRHTPLTDAFAVAPRATSPIAISFIVDYRSFLLMHIVFALADPLLETINTLFGPVFLDMMRCMEEEWDILVNSVETGVLPDWEGTSHVRQYLEVKLNSLKSHAHLSVHLPAKIHSETRTSCASTCCWKGNKATRVAQKVMARAQRSHWHCEWYIFHRHSKGMPICSSLRPTLNSRRCSTISVRTYACGVWGSPQARLTLGPRSVPLISVFLKRPTTTLSSTLT